MWTKALLPKILLSNLDNNFSLFTTKSIYRNLTPWSSKTMGNLCLFHTAIRRAVI